MPDVALSSGVIVACGLDRQQQARVTDALKHRVPLRFVESSDHLMAALRDGSAQVDVVLIGIHTDSGSITELIRRIASSWPDVAIVIYGFGAFPLNDVRALTLAGAHQFLIAGVNELGSAFRDVVEAARRGCAAERVMARLAPLVPATLHRVAEAILARPERVTTVPAIASALRIHRKTLFNWCTHAKFLPPAELLVWVRLALVAYHLETTGRTVEAIALNLGYPSDNALRNTMKRYTGFTATEVRARGGTQVVLAALGRKASDRPSIELHIE